MSQSQRRWLQRKYERECARKGHQFIRTGIGLARCSHCGETVSLLNLNNQMKAKEPIR